MSGGVMVMAGGTGGHVFPALAVAEELRSRGVPVSWLGAPDSFESRLVPGHQFDLHLMQIRGLRGNGLRGWLVAPFRLGRALIQARRILRRVRPRVVLGMGGFVTGPGGLMARLSGIPLVIHEQNAIPGMTNSLLSRIANRVFEAFPGSFRASIGAVACGNPVRREISALEGPAVRMLGREGPLRILVIGGSLGAQALNQSIPAVIGGLAPQRRPLIRHQAGRDKVELTREHYANAGVEAEVVPFIADMAEAYAWADLVICRAGALTVSELASAGVAAVLVPYPFAVDDHQTRNAEYLVKAGAAKLLPQRELERSGFPSELVAMFDDRQRLMEMSVRARALSIPDATARVADYCEEMAGR
ncbi:MAG: undecaprenyldiphospho-muramoylpentapeptide beta-N-acetylglucosaminyltransferase [Sedimenticola sp.]|nr:undecaprenyldiphospho-muramoylpentapeptide beta-N-acetylglucosaminyltransferase [Sedimenticola sp.]